MGKSFGTHSNSGPGNQIEKGAIDLKLIITIQNLKEIELYLVGKITSIFKIIYLHRQTAEKVIGSI